MHDKGNWFRIQDEWCLLRPKFLWCMLLSGRINIQVGSSERNSPVFSLQTCLCALSHPLQATSLIITSYFGCICQSYGSRLEPNSAHTHCVFVRPDELRWWGFNFQDILWLRPMLVACQYFPHFALRSFYRYKNHETATHYPSPLHLSPTPVLQRGLMLDSGGHLCRTCRVQLHHEVFTTNSGGLQCWSSTRCSEWCQWLRDFFGGRHGWEGKSNDVYGRGSPMSLHVIARACSSYIVLRWFTGVVPENVKLRNEEVFMVQSNVSRGLLLIEMLKQLPRHWVWNSKMEQEEAGCSSSMSDGMLIRVGGLISVVPWLRRISKLESCSHISL